MCVQAFHAKANEAESEATDAEGTVSWKEWAGNVTAPTPTATEIVVTKLGTVVGVVEPVGGAREAVVSASGLRLVGTGTASFYARSFEGGRTACGTTFRHSDPSVAAVAVSRGATWPCGTRLMLRGPAGEWMVTRSDSCGGCGANDIDLSESGFQHVCGALSIGRCRIEIRQPG